MKTKYEIYLEAENERLRKERRRDALDGQAALDESNNAMVALRARVAALEEALRNIADNCETPGPDPAWKLLQARAVAVTALDVKPCEECGGTGEVVTVEQCRICVGTGKEKTDED